MADVPPGGFSFSTLPQEAKDELSSIIGGQVANMLKAKFKTFLDKDLKEAIGPMLGESLKATLPDLIKGIVPPAPDPDADPDGKGGKGGKTAALKELETKLSTLSSANKELTDRLNAAETAREQERQSSIAVKLRSTVMSALANVGITDSGQAEIAAGHLIAVAKAVRWDDDTNQPLFNDGAQEIDLNQGLRNWARTPQAKYFLPATGANGSGSRGGGSGAGASGTVSKDKALEHVFGTLLDKAL